MKIWKIFAKITTLNHYFVFSFHEISFLEQKRVMTEQSDADPVIEEEFEKKLNELQITSPVLPEKLQSMFS